MEDTSIVKFDSVHKSYTELLIHENCTIILSVNNTLVWRTAFLGHITHYHMGLYTAPPIIQKDNTSTK